MGNSNSMAVTPDVPVTTQQAADYLNVSRHYLMKLLAAGSIPSVGEGLDAKIRFSDLEAYRTKVHSDRMAALGELTRLDQELGLGCVSEARNDGTRFDR